MSFCTQSRFNARFEWGLRGCEELAPQSSVVIIVDVLSFSTSVDIAVSRGAVVYPALNPGDSAEKLAQEKQIVPAASGDKMSEKKPLILFPGWFENVEIGTRVTLTSWNGATVSLKASEHCKHVLCGCLRNAAAVAAAAKSLGPVVSVIAAGERWFDDPEKLRPSFEDLIGAGAILHALNASAPSPESFAAIAAFKACENRIETLMLDCSSGRELVNAGYRHDVILASELNVSTFAPYLLDGGFISCNMLE